MSLTQLLARPLIWLIRLYQVAISPLLPPSCRFTPCCSSYAITALRRFGIVRGGWLTVRRLARCHPWNHGGVDHVPPVEVQRAQTQGACAGLALQGARDRNDQHRVSPVVTPDRPGKHTPAPLNCGVDSARPLSPK